MSPSNAEVTQISQAIAFAAGMAEEARAGVTSMEMLIESLTAGEVTGRPLTLAAAAQELYGQIAVMFERPRAVLERHLVIAESYAAVPAAGNKHFLEVGGAQEDSFMPDDEAKGEDQPDNRIADVATRLPAAASRKEAAELLNGLTQKELAQVAKMLGKEIYGRRKADQLRNLVDHVVGNRLDHEAIQNYPGQARSFPGRDPMSDNEPKGEDQRTPTTAEYTFDETYGDSAGKTVVGDVVKANKSTVYVKWRTTGRIEPVSRRKPDGVVFKSDNETKGQGYRQPSLAEVRRGGRFGQHVLPDRADDMGVEQLVRVIFKPQPMFPGLPCKDPCDPALVQQLLDYAPRTDRTGVDDWDRPLRADEVAEIYGTPMEGDPLDVRIAWCVAPTNCAGPGANHWPGRAVWSPT